MIALELTDGFGRVWDLTAPGACPSVRFPGVRGLGRPELEPVRRPTSPAVHGRSWDGWRAASREVKLPLRFESYDGTLAATVRDFAAAIVPEQPGMPGPARCRLAAILPDATRWDVPLWLEDDGGLELGYDPDVMGLLRIPTTWDAGVFWDGPAWTGTWGADTPPPTWFLASGGVAALASSHSMAAASTLNLGDVRAWPVWTISGPCTAATVGVDGHQVTLTATLTAGQSVTINTEPAEGQTAIRNDGTDLTSSLTAVDFAPVEPSRTPIPLQISMTGTGSVSMTYRPRRLAIW